MLGTVDHSSAHGTAHAGAVYLHQGETWLVTDLDLEGSVAIVAPVDPGYSTSAREVTDIEILAERESRDLGAARLSLGEVQVSHQVVSFLKRRLPGGEVIGEDPLDLPERTAADHGGLVDAARARAGRVRRGGARPARARPTRPSTPRSACCPCSRPATAGTSAGSRPPCTPTPAGYRLRPRRPPRRRRLRRARLPCRRRLAAGHARGHPRRAGAPKVAPRASSPPSAATRTTRSTSPVRSRCSTCCSPGLPAARLGAPRSERKCPCSSLRSCSCSSPSCW